MTIHIEQANNWKKTECGRRTYSFNAALDYKDAVKWTFEDSRMTICKECAQS